MTHFEIDAELEALLGEVARNPRATLLRVARPTAFREAFEALREVEPHATGLIAAERELLREHRAQLARLLRQACVTKIYAHPAARGRFVRYQTTAGPIEVLEPRRWRERARDELRASEPARDELEGFELLERLAAADGEIAADTAQLATASMRLLPTDEARIYSAVAVALEGDTHTARRSFAQVAATAPSASMVAHAWSNAGWMHAAENQLEEASAAYRTAARFDEANLAPLVHGFAVALLQGDARNARRVAVQLDSLAQYHHSLLSDLSVAMMRDSASWSVHRVAVDRTLGTIETSLGPLSSALAHLIH